MYSIRIVKPAQTDMREIYRYINDEWNDPIAAATRINLINDGIQALKTMPGKFPLVRDSYLASKGFRAIPVKNHLVFFIIREETKMVYVMRVLYARRDWARVLKVDVDQISDSFLL